MNKQIKELAEQAGLRFTQLMSNPMVPVVDGKETDLAKFAELIIAECVSIVNDAKRGGNNEVWDNAVKFIRRDLQEHFGVDDE
jgi:hypothetical protein